MLFLICLVILVIFVLVRDHIERITEGPPILRTLDHDV